MGKVKRFLAACGDFLFPKRCALCGEVMGFYEKADLCPECAALYEAELAKVCPACRQSCRDCACSDSDYRPFGSADHTALGFYREYDDPVGRLVYRLKREYDRDLQKFFARSLADALRRDLGGRLGGFCITFPPRGMKAMRKYGFDQSEKLSYLVAQYVDCDWDRVFLRVGGEIQKKLTSEERMKNAAEMFVIADDAEVAGKRFIVIDDVMTTGATLGALAKLLYSAGAAEVYPASLFVTLPKERKPKDEGLWFEE